MLSCNEGLYHNANAERNRIKVAWAQENVEFSSIVAGLSNFNFKEFDSSSLIIFFKCYFFYVPCPKFRSILSCYDNNKLYFNLFLIKTEY